MKRPPPGLFFSVLLLLAMAAGIRSQAQVAYDRIMRELASDFETPGVAMAIMDHDQFKEYLFGQSAIQSGKAISERTVFNVASISKMVTAISVLRLTEQGLVDLDAPIQNYLKSWRLPASDYKTREITVRRVLNHSAGFSREFGPGFTKSDSLLSLVDILSGKSPKRQAPRIVYEPGTGHLYSNIGYGILQLLVEDITGEKFKDYVKRTILDPLGMRNSQFEDPLSLPDSVDLATPYNHMLEPLEQERFVVVAAAGLLSNLQDLEKLMREETRERRSLSQPGYGQLTSQYDSSGYGLGHTLSFQGNKIVLVGHTGLGTGWNSCFEFMPDSGKGIIVLTNGDNGYYIHNTLACYWYYTETGKRISLCNVPLNKKLNRLELLIEIAARLDQLKTDDAEKYLAQIKELRGNLEKDEVSSFSKGLSALRTELNAVLGDEKIPENALPPQFKPLLPSGNFKVEMNGQFESLLKWLHLAWTEGN